MPIGRGGRVASASRNHLAGRGSTVSPAYPIEKISSTPMNHRTPVSK